MAILPNLHSISICDGDAQSLAETRNFAGRISMYVLIRILRRHLCLEGEGSTDLVVLARARARE